MGDLKNSVCLNHPDVPASFRCAVCGKPICSDCAIKDGGMTYCSQQCRADAIRTGAMVSNVNAHKNTGNTKRLIIKLVWLIIIVALAAGGYYYYTQHKGEIDSKIQQGKQQFEQGVKDTKKTIEDNTVNRKSKYKKDRERMVEEN